LNVMMTHDPTPTAELQHRSLARLNAALDLVRDAPRDRGVLHLIVRRPAVGVREVLEEGELAPDTGLVGDTWHVRHSPRTDDGAPHPDTQITLMSVRAIGAITSDETRWPLAGDQLFVDLDLASANLPAGTRLQVGGAELEVTAQPHTGCGKFVARFGVDAMKWVNAPDGRALNLRGIYAKVVQGGHVRQGDAVTVRR
jgi:MOSC domain-containing protein YiiM